MKTLEKLLAQQRISAGDVRYMSEQVRYQIVTSTAACHGGIRERIYWLQHGLTNYPHCAQCESPLSSKNFSINVKDGAYSRYCSARCAANCDKVTAKKICTNMKKYGSAHYLGSTAARQKIEQTNIARYGQACPHPWLSDKFNSLILKKYGTLNIMDVPGRSKKITRSIIATNIDTGKTFSSIRACEIRHSCTCVNSELAFDYNRDILENINFTWKHAVCGKEYSSRITDGDIQVCPSCHSSVSNLELSLRGLVLELAPDAQFKVKGLLSRNREFDIFIPSARLAIEFNGIYWHSALRNTSKSYHLDKTRDAAAAGLRLIHIWENDFLQKYHIIRSLIVHALGKSSVKINARACAVTEIEPARATKFLVANSLQRGVAGSYNLGLVFNNQLVQVMTFSKCRFRKNEEWEIRNIVSLVDANIRGGVSKLFKAFIKKQNPLSVRATCNRCYSTGAALDKLGFKFIKNSAPNYFWANVGSSTVLGRYQSQKCRLESLLGSAFDASLSECENMKRIGWFKLWDCGNSSWKWRVE